MNSLFKLLSVSLFLMLLSFDSFGQNVFGFNYYTNEEDTVIVTSVLKNSPADKAGLKPGDFLNFLNDIPFSFKKRDLLAKVISDAPATNNELRFYRNPDVKQVIINKAPLSSFEFICISGDCNAGDCIIESAYGYTIKGKCSNNKISGEAEFYNANGLLIYKGNVLANKFDGKGIQYGENNIRFEGNYKNGFRNGAGKVIYPDNSYLTGVWKEDKIEGSAQFFNAQTNTLFNRTYANGKLEQETNASSAVANNSTTNTPVTVVKSAPKITKDPAVNKAIREKMYYITGNARARYFNNEMIILPEFEKVPFTKAQMKEMSSFTYTTLAESDYILEQCKLENYPSFYQNNSDLEEILTGPFRNLIGDEVISFQVEEDKNGFSTYATYSVLFISNANNPHAPSELLSDDGYGFFICVNNKTLSTQPGTKNVYTAFTLDNYRKNRGFKNWADKRRAYLIDMDYIYENFSVDAYGGITEELNITESELSQLKEWSSISNAPEGLNTLTKVKDAHRNAKLIDAVVYEIYKGLYYMPAEENQHLEAAYRPKSSEGWYFTTSTSIINYNPAGESYRQSILAGTDANMERYRIEQAAREEKMRADALALEEWKEKNKFKGVLIIQYEGNVNDNANEDLVRVVSIFGPQNQYFTEADRSAIEEEYESIAWKKITSRYRDDINISQAISYLTGEGGFDNSSINSNFSYTLPERISGSGSDELERIDAELEKNQQERDRLYKEMMEGNTIQKTEQLTKEMTDVLSTTGPEILLGTSVEILSVDPTNANFNELKNYIGKVGVTKSVLKPNSDGSYSGKIEFSFDSKEVSFEKVKVKVKP